MWEIVQAGGPMMWPIIFCSVMAMAIILERLWTLQGKRVMPPGLTAKVRLIVDDGQISEQLLQALANGSPLGRVLAVPLRHSHRPHAVIIERLQDTGRHVVLELERYLTTLGTIAAIAPLMGLLGTVSGIIKSFNAITIVGLGDPRALSGGIAEALICTAAGLGVAIPSLVAFRHLRSRVDRIAVAIEKDALLVADAVEAKQA
jgi:biopolymer transport protein ExbB